MHRRTFLKSAALVVGVMGSGSLLSACGDSSGIPSGDPTLSVVTGSYEILPSPQRRIAFGVRDLENNPVTGDEIEVYLRDMDGNTLAGPYPTEYADGDGAGLGLYLVTVELAEPGQPLLVAVRDGDFGEAALNVVDPANSQVPVPGAQAAAVTTPTVDDDMGMVALCTQDPACGMHDVSLDDALADGRPVVLLFATPAYCQTAVCGPAVGTLDQVREAQDWGDTAFIHTEIFSDEGQQVAQPVAEWGLPTEPWLFTIGADGAIVDRLDGPMVGSEVTRLVEGVAST